MRRLNPLPQLVPDRFRLIRQQVDGLIWERRERLAVEGSAVTGERLRAGQAAELAYAPVHAGEHFGAAGGGWEHRWFRLRVPAAPAAEAGRRFLRWKSQGETTVYRDGVPWAGLDVGHPTCPLPDAAAELYLDTGTWATGIWAPGAEPIGPYGARFDYAELRVRDAAAWDLKWDLDALLQLAEMLLADDGLQVPNAGHGQRPPFDEASPLLRKLVRGIDRCCDAWVAGGVAGMKAAAGELLAALPAESWQPRAALIGHAHIDVVWLWPETATRHKNVHSFATALRLLEAYPEMVFAHSTPAVYRAVQEDAPALIPQIKRHLAAGRWELMGGFEVEPDVNLPAGEALARSAVYGNRFIAGFSGKPSDVCWIPDVFGYSNCLPQILRLAGITRFYTTKMTWSQVTRFPYNSFVWRGSDGVSEVTTHLATIGYNGQVALAENRDALRRHRQLDVHDALLIGTGLGDGGGGPNEMVAERARRFGNLAGAPRHGWHSSAAFFDDLDAVRDQLPVYQGELYMEAHRGVLTSQAEYKRLYRACESALLAHEALRAVDGAAPLGEAAWLRVLFGQFHDALPGSSITRVYDELKAEFRQILARERAATAQELGGGSAAGRPGRPAPRRPALRRRALHRRALHRRAPRTWASWKRSRSIPCRRRAGSTSRSATCCSTCRRWVPRPSPRRGRRPRCTPAATGSTTASWRRASTSAASSPGSPSKAKRWSWRRRPGCAWRTTIRTTTTPGRSTTTAPRPRSRWPTRCSCRSRREPGAAACCKARPRSALRAASPFATCSIPAAAT